jgi:hypothetical protein
MPRITVNGPSNADATYEASLRLRTREERLSSAGTSSSQSGERPDRSGSSLLDMGSSSLSPAPEMASPSSPDHQASLAPSGSATSADGSTQETGSGQQSQLASSGHQQASQVTAGASTDGPSEEEPSGGGFLVPDPALAADKYRAAGAAYNNRNYDEASELLDEVVRLDPSMAAQVKTARESIEAARLQ